jgi:hypothetical protein
MPTECNADQFGFARIDGRAGQITSDAGALLLGAADRAIRLIDRFAGCFSDSRAAAGRAEVAALVGQRDFGIVLGYEDVVDHDELRRDATMAVFAGKPAGHRPHRSLPWHCIRRQAARPQLPDLAAVG